MTWNPRYLAYATAQGLSPKDCLARDTELWPGGKMTGYLLWIHRQWRDWDEKNKHPAEHIRDSEEHRAFDAWLQQGRP